MRFLCTLLLLISCQSIIGQTDIKYEILKNIEVDLDHIFNHRYRMKEEMKELLKIYNKTNKVDSNYTRPYSRLAFTMFPIFDKLKIIDSLYPEFRNLDSTQVMPFFFDRKANVQMLWIKKVESSQTVNLPKNILVKCYFDFDLGLIKIISEYFNDLKYSYYTGMQKLVMKEESNEKIEEDFTTIFNDLLNCR